MKVLRVATVVAAVLVVALARPWSSSAEKRSGISGVATPTTFKVSLYPSGQNHYKIRWTGKELEYRVEPIGSKAKVVRLKPSHKAWLRFWQAINSLGVWQWQPSYSPPSGSPDPTVGIKWSAKIVYKNQSINSKGYIATPDKFQGFTRAVSQLVGGRKVQYP